MSTEIDDQPNHESKQLLKDLGKRTSCYLRVRTNNNGSTGVLSTANLQVVDDVGCPVGNVKSFRVEANPTDTPTLILELYCSGVEIIT